MPTIWMKRLRFSNAVLTATRRRCSLRVARRPGGSATRRPRATLASTSALRLPWHIFLSAAGKTASSAIMHAQGRDAIEFYTEKKIVVERWAKEHSRKFYRSGSGHVGAVGEFLLLNIGEPCSPPGRGRQGLRSPNNKIEAFMSDTIQKYKDFVMTGFMKSVVPIVIDKASGVTVTDINGREYLDCFAGISVVNAGHCNPQVIAAAKAQMDKLVHCSSYIYHVQPVADLAEKIAHIAPRGLTKTFFGNGGAEAIEGAMKLARLYTGKHEFIALHASFHGRSWGALSVTGNMGRKKRGGPYAAGVSFCACSLCLSLAMAQRS